MYIRKFSLIISFLSIVRLLNAQDLPRIIQPSPIAMQFQKFGDYPVSNFTGVPDITIPLYTIKEGDLEVPITLSYHASGIKPDDPNGILGAGWVLNTGGIITRTEINGSDDIGTLPITPFPTEEYLNNLMTANRYDENTFTYVKGAASGNTMPDIFSYNFLGNNGKFIFRNFHPINYDEECLLLDYKPLSIKGVREQGALFSFNVIDEKGRKYKFNPGGPGGSTSYGAFAWSLNTLTSSTDPTNVISYSYGDGISETVHKREDIYRRDDNPNALTIVRSNCVGEWDFSDIAMYMDHDFTWWGFDNPFASGEAPAVIAFRSGDIRFTYDGSTKMLSRMEVYNKANTLIKRIDFTIHQSYSGLSRPFLKEIKFFDTAGAYINKYAFNYTQEDYQMFVASNISTDFWGYYNGQIASGEALIPEFTFEFYSFYSNYLKAVGANRRQASEENMKIYTLEEIIYPTGGKTVFEFEANKLNYLGQIPNYFTYDVGGLRIKRKLNYTADNKLAEVKEYEYGPGQMDVIPTKEYFAWSQQGHVLSSHSWERFRRVFVSSNPAVNIAPHGSPVVYPNVRERIMGPDYKQGALPLGVIEYNYDYKSYSNYSWPTTNGPTNDQIYALYRPYQSLYEANNDGKLISMNIFGRENGINTIHYVYEEIPGESVAGLYSDRAILFLEDPCPCNPNNGPCPGDPEHEFPLKGGAFSAYNFGNVLVKSSRKRLKQTIRWDAAENQGSMETVTDYIYDNPIHDQPTKEIVKNSKGETITTAYKYPHDFPLQEPYISMVNRHIWSPVIEETITKVGEPVPLQTVKTSFGFSNGSYILPLMVETRVQSNSQDERVRFESYDDRGNITTVSKKNDIRMSYIWGYNKVYPIAEVTNASADQIAFTSFEDTELGGWLLKAGSLIIDGNIIAGKKICSGGVTKTVPNGDYVVTLWSNGSCSVNGLQGTQLAVSKRNGNWVCLEWKLENVNTLDVTGVNIDDVRLYPVDAQMTTYTFDPLIGMTTKSDINNRISYYEYDAACRIQHVRDDGYNILKKYQYTFQDNNENSDASRFPNWQNTGANRYQPCLANPNFTNGIVEFEQIDANPGSSTYLQKRYVKATDGIFPESDWQFTNNYRCKEDGGQLTGEKEREQINRNPCHFNFGKSKWVVVVTNSPDCPQPTVYTNTEDLSGDYYSTLCNTPAYAPLPYHVPMPPGMFTSTISYQDVLNKAWAYAQHEADVNGQCQLQPIQINFANNSSNGTEEFEIILFNNENEYHYYDVQNNQSLGPIVPGIYEVAIYPKSNSSTMPVSYEYFLGCNYSFIGGDIQVSNITFDFNCNTITVQ